MKCVTLLVVVAVVFLAVLRDGAKGDLPPPEASYKILMLLPVCSRSHKNVFMPLAEAMADRGHEITILSNQPKMSENPRIHDFDHGVRHYDEETLGVFSMRLDGMGGLKHVGKLLPLVARDLYKIPKVMDLYKRRKEFDVIIVNNFFGEMAFPFVHEMPFIVITPNGVDPRQSAVLGNVLNPAYVPNILFDFRGRLTAWQRFLNMFGHIWIAVQWRIWAIVPLVQREISAHFPDLPPLLEIERNQSLALVNSHFSISKTVPLLPSQVEIGAMHCRPANPLPQDLESWISGSGPKGVIYFSLGSVARGDFLPPHYQDVLVEAFRRLPQYRIVWKYAKDVEGVSENVLIRKWLPQQDILGHSKVKVFISHGGLLSLQESIYHSTPLLVLPIFSDQPKNAVFVVNSGIGEMLVWEKLTVDAVLDALTKITTNPEYKENVIHMSKPLRDQLTTPVDRAVFWTEYVIRHRGAPQLRSPAAQLSWVQFLMLDVLAVLAVGLFMASYVLYRIMRFIAVKFFGGTENKKKTE